MDCGDLRESSLLFVRSAQPFNAEPQASALVEFQLTPEDLFYCRNHSLVKELDEEGYTITVNGNVTTELKLTLHELRTLFTTVQVVAALQVKPVLIDSPEND
jgi:sulfite oxidase